MSTNLTSHEQFTLVPLSDIASSLHIPMRTIEASLFAAIGAYSAKKIDGKLYVHQSLVPQLTEYLKAHDKKRAKNNQQRKELEETGITVGNVSEYLHVSHKEAIDLVQRSKIAIVDLDGDVYLKQPDLEKLRRYKQQHDSGIPLSQLKLARDTFHKGKEPWIDFYMACDILDITDERLTGLIRRGDGMFELERHDNRTVVSRKSIEYAIKYYELNGHF